MRNTLEQYHAMHSQIDVTRLYLPRKNFGRGLVNITSNYKNAIINLISYRLNSEEQFLKLTSNWQVRRGEKSIHQKTQRYCNEIGCDIQQLAAMRKLPRKITINLHVSTNWRRNSKESIEWAICKISWPTSCRQRAVQPMAKIFYTKKIYRVNNSCHPRTGNLHQTY